FYGGYLAVVGLPHETNRLGHVSSTRRVFSVFTPRARRLAGSGSHGAGRRLDRMVPRRDRWMVYLLRLRVSVQTRLGKTGFRDVLDPRYPRSSANRIHVRVVAH